MAPNSDQMFQRIAADVVIGNDARIAAFVNLYGCTIGEGSRIGTFVEIQRGAAVGKRCKIQSHTFICEGVTIDDEAFIGHGVIFINDRFPKSTNDDGTLKGGTDWTCEKTHVGRRASIGSGAVIMCGVSIGDGALVGAGAVVTSDVAPNSTVVGVPARLLPRGGLDRNDS